MHRIITTALLVLVTLGIAVAQTAPLHLITRFGLRMEAPKSYSPAGSDQAFVNMESFNDGTVLVEFKGQVTQPNSLVVRVEGTETGLTIKSATVNRVRFVPPAMEQNGAVVLLVEGQ